ncbi:MAG: acyl-CoA thioesterase [Rhodocyclaceae bacterium]|nr:acyl-CoA thioesterase [Rhodocyclaceae bacterium]
MTPLPPIPRDPRLTQRRFFTHWVTERVRWSDTDQVGHVNNLAFCTYIETGRTEFMRHLVSRDVESRVLLLMAQINVSFLGEVHWPSDVDVGTCVLDIGRSSCRIGHGLFLGEQCVSSADSLLVMIDESTRKPQEIPPHVRAHLAEFLPRAEGLPSAA